MAQLNNTIVNGILRAGTGAFNTIKDSTGSVGSNKYVLTSTGATIRWADMTTLKLTQMVLVNSSGYTTTLKPATGNANYTVTFPSGNGTLALDTTFSGATASAAGSKGLVPAPAAASQHAFLIGNATWKTVSILDGGNAGTAAAAWGTFE